MVEIGEMRMQRCDKVLGKGIIRGTVFRVEREVIVITPKKVF